LNHEIFALSGWKMLAFLKKKSLHASSNPAPHCGRRPGASIFSADLLRPFACTLGLSRCDDVFTACIVKREIGEPLQKAKPMLPPQR